MKILINTVDIAKSGGVANYYRIIKDRFVCEVDYFTIGARTDHDRTWRKPLRLIDDYKRFYGRLKNEDYDVVTINPSLNAKGFFRDALFLLIAKVFQKKVVVFFHGWDKDFERRANDYLSFLIRHVYFKADACIVLASEFKDRLRSWGYKKEIFIETTIVDDNDFFSVDEARFAVRAENPSVTILFLARVERSKGVYEAIDAYAELRSRLSYARLVIAGDGAEAHNARVYVQTKQIPDITFLGNVDGEAKKRAFLNAALYLLPTWEEGMPLSVLEAMSYALPVVTRPVGGLKDMFENGQMGLSSIGKDPGVFATLLEQLASDKQLRYRIGLYNREYIKEYCLASNAVTRLEQIFRNLGNEGIDLRTGVRGKSEYANKQSVDS